MLAKGGLIVNACELAALARRSPTWPSGAGKLGWGLPRLAWALVASDLRWRTP